MNKERSKSVEKLREYLQNAPKEELDARTARVEALFPKQETEVNNLQLIQTLTLLLLRKCVKVVYKSKEELKIDGKYHGARGEAGYILIEWYE